MCIFVHRKYQSAQHYDHYQQVADMLQQCTLVSELSLSFSLSLYIYI